MDELSEIRSRYDFVKRFFNEKARRLFLASEAKTIGWGGIEKVSRATGVSNDTISKGCKELDEEPELIESGKIKLRAATPPQRMGYAAGPHARFSGVQKSSSLGA